LRGCVWVAPHQRTCSSTVATSRLPSRKKPLAGRLARDWRKKKKQKKRHSVLVAQMEYTRVRVCVCRGQCASAVDWKAKRRLASQTARLPSPATARSLCLGPTLHTYTHTYIDAYIYVNRKRPPTHVHTQHITTQHTSVQLELSLLLLIPQVLTAKAKAAGSLELALVLPPCVVCAVLQTVPQACRWVALIKSMKSQRERQREAHNTLARAQTHPGRCLYFSGQ
jgi:hypothetical protein